ncbi:cupin domain-containing protein [Paenibacillus periandrae]|uniref:cupin domain-containing protein n=1 Tax=Paenibacillus periandrae TaxID=1761741 RepID=UPI001F0936E6|nr:cupin domain-containing protein [Paenibacillus periandrae]
MGNVMKVRRFVTGHDQNGEAVIELEDIIEGTEVEGDIGTASFALIWTTDTHPVNNQDVVDGSKREFGLVSPGGTVFRIVDLYTSHQSPMHRTQSLDYGIVLEGEVEMELDAGKCVQLSAGDVVVQRGTIHAWRNIGTKTCRIAFVLVDAEAVSIGSRVLTATHD